MSDPTPPIVDTAMRLHAVRFPDGTLYRCGFPTPMEAESFRAKQFGHRADGPIGEIIEVAAVPVEQWASQLQLIRDLYDELKGVSTPGHGGSESFFDPRDVELENRIRKAIGLQELPPPPPPRRLTAEECDPARNAKIIDDALCGSVSAVADSIGSQLAAKFMAKR